MRFLAAKMFFSGLVCLLLSNNSGWSQSTFLTIRHIEVSGNVKTKKFVILQELDFKEGDSIRFEDLSAVMLKNNGRLESLNLFTKSNINIKNWDSTHNFIDIYITVQENWYIYPYPILELADRNFNVWRKEFNYSIDRLNYGIGLKHINLTGRNDALSLKLHGGYTSKYEFVYEYPNVFKRWGLSANVLYATNKEFGYISKDNILNFYKYEGEKPIFTQLKARIGIQNRSSIYIFQKLSLGFTMAKIGEAFDIQLNPNYFAPNQKKLSILDVEYIIKADKTTFPLYPTNGIRGEFVFKHEGFSDEVQTTALSMSLETFAPLMKNLFLSNGLHFKFNAQSKPIPYYLYKGIGYSKYSILGYQLYVMEAKDFVVLNNTLTYKVLDFDHRFKNWMPRQFKTFNLKSFVKFGFDVGYANDPYFGDINPLSNNVQYGYGPGVDFILYNIATISVSYGLNKLGQKAWYFEALMSF